MNEEAAYRTVKVH